MAGEIEKRAHPFSTACIAGADVGCLQFAGAKVVRKQTQGESQPDSGSRQAAELEP